MLCIGAQGHACKHRLDHVEAVDFQSSEDVDAQTGLLAYLFEALFLLLARLAQLLGYLLFFTHRLSLWVVKW